MQRITLLLVSVFLSSAVCISAMADAYYVNDAEPDDGVAAGSAANSGTSPDDPVNSVQVLLDRYPEIGSGCTVYVSPGTYYGNIVLDSPHSGLVLVGAGADVTKIDSAYGDPCLTLTDFTGGTITGFSFVNGWSTPAGGGGGAEIWSSSVVITGNVFSGNYLDMADGGGGVFIGPDSSVVFADNDVSGNFGDGLVCSFASGSLISGNRITGNVGDGIACRSCSPAITGNLVTGNGAWWGGGISCSDLAGIAVTNNTIADNGTSGWGGVGILCTGADVILRNCIVWGNSLQIALVWTSTTTVSYSGVKGGNAAIYRESGSTFSWGTGNIDSDPQFVSRGYRDDNGTADIWDDFWVEGDYHLLSAGGRWDPALGDWVLDSVTSPCIDSGDPLYAVFDEPEPNGGRTNLGSYGNTSQASRTPNLLIVMSTPAAGIAIGGTIPGTTFYTIFRGGVVILSAPHQALIQGVLHKFVRWTVDDVPMPDGQTDVDVALVSFRNATVAYEPAPASVVANLVAELVPIAEPVAATGATTSTVLNTGYTAAMAIDGNTSTAWVSAACFDPRREYITIDTGGLHPVAGVRMLPRSGYPGLFPANFDILASVDGTVWTRVASEAGYAGASGIWYQNAFAERPARYVRIDAPAGMLYTNGRHYVQIAEVQALTAARMFLRLRWTAPEGDVAGYEIRYAGNELADDQLWQAGTVLASPSPSVPAGGIETVTIGIDGLPPQVRLYIALKSRTAAGILSGVSNNPFVDMPAAHAAITDLAAELVDYDPPSRLVPVAARASSVLYNSYLPAYVCDGDESTFWSSTGSKQASEESVTIDLGAVQTVEKVRILPRTGFVHLLPAAFVVEASTDGVGWANVFSESGYVASTGLWYERAFAPCQARHLRVRIPATMPHPPNGLFYAQIAEFQAYPHAPASQVKAEASAVEASTVLYGTYVAAYACDGDTATFWGSAPSSKPRPEQLTLSWPVAQIVSRVRLLPRSGSANLFPARFTIECSVDGLQWKPLAVESAYAARDGIWYEKDFTGRVARHLRIAIPEGNILPRNGLHYVQIAEAEAYVSASSAITLGWTPPPSGPTQPTDYQVRYGTGEITDLTLWRDATIIDAEAAPGQDGKITVSVGLESLPADSDVYIAVRSTRNPELNPPISNSAMVHTPPAQGARMPHFRHETIDASPPGQQLDITLIHDLNGDGRPDIIIGGKAGQSNLFWYQNPSWERHHMAYSPNLEAGGVVVDVNRDGRPDVVCGQQWTGTGFYWFECPADPTQQWTRHVIQSQYMMYHDQAVADIDGDGELEIITHAQLSRVLVYYDIPPDPYQSPWPAALSHPIANNLDNTEGLVVIDIDGDGQLEIVAGSNIFDPPAIPGKIWGRRQIASGYEKTRVAVGDIDGDGLLDVVLSEGETDVGRLTWFSQRDWQPRVLRTDLFHPHSLALADFDGDGMLDIFVAEMGLGRNPDPEMLIFVNQGRGSFEQIVISRGVPTHEAKLADLNGDGKLDVVGKSYDPENHVDVWWNEMR